MRGAKETREGDENIAILRYKNLGIPNPDLNAHQRCLVCEKLKKLDIFAAKRISNVDGIVTQYVNIYNICQACMKQARAFRVVV